jgi:hypothetical protein
MFSHDMGDFIFSLFLRHRFNKIVFRVVVGNPAEDIYDRFCVKYGGRIVGVLKDNVKLLDGKNYDEKLYEIMLNDFEKSIGEKRLIRLRVTHGW